MRILCPLVGARTRILRPEAKRRGMRARSPDTQQTQNASPLRGSQNRKDVIAMERQTLFMA